MDNTSVVSYNYQLPASTLENIFNRIIQTTEEIVLSVDILKDIIKNDLHLKLDHLDDDKRTAVPYMLMRYIKTWPGWSRKQEYDNGTLELSSWKLRFRNYICYKMQLLVTKTLPQFETNSSNESETCTAKYVDAGTQLESLRTFSNFSIDVSGPAIIMNNLVFAAAGEDVRAELHAEWPWVDLEYADLLNYPYVQVEFNSPNLSFKRSFEPKTTMYLSKTSDFILDKSVFVLGSSTINSTYPKWPVKLSILEAYIKAFTLTVFTQFQMSSHEHAELNTVLGQFYQDMVDINQKGMVQENRRITFNIGRNVYKRTKKITNGDATPEVLFNEIFLPRVILSFRYFTGMQNDAKNKIVADPSKIDYKYMVAFKPVISYKCLFCKIAFDGSEARLDLHKHLKEIHRRPQTLVCVRCNKCIEVKDLSRARWACMHFN